MCFGWKGTALKEVANKSVKEKGYLCAVEEKQSEIGVEIKEWKLNQSSVWSPR